MSQIAIRAGLESRLDAMTPALATAWQNKAFAPPAVSVPYQVVTLLFADPDNREAGAAYREIGFMQVSLKYPQGAGTKDSVTRAALVRETFKKGTTVVNGGVTTIVNATPTISNGVVEVDRWSLTVKIPFQADIN